MTAPAGSQLVLLIGSANRDERVFTDPEHFDIDRDPAEWGQIMSFGGGRHFCLGANLARLEARIALRGAGRAAWARSRSSTTARSACLLRQRARLRAPADDGDAPMSSEKYTAP